MDHLALEQDALSAYSFDPNGQHHFSAVPANATWPLPLPPDQQNMSSNANVGASPTARRANTLASGLPSRPATTAPPLQTTGLEYAHAVDQSALMSTAWQYQMPQHQSYMADATLDSSQYGAAGAFSGTLQASPIDFTTSAVQATMGASLPMNSQTFLPYSTGAPMDSLGNVSAMASNYQMSDFANELVNYGMSDSNFHSHDHIPSSVSNSSPSETWLEVRSISSKSDAGWNVVDATDPARHSFEYANDYSGTGAINPQQTLHVRTDSNGSWSSDVPHSAHSFSSWEDVGNFPLYSPEPEVDPEPSQTQAVSVHHGMPTLYHNHSECDQHHYHGHVSPPLPTATMSDPVPIQPASSSTSPLSSGASSPTHRRRKSPVGITPKVIIKKKAPTSPIKKEAQNEKRVGRRKGPLRPDQRQQAHEIRKLRACLRCKFLKKTCDKGDPCGGCQPSHARLWQVPCTRIDIKDIGYFLKDWKADYERHVSLGFSVGNIKGFSTMERPLYITHGYGYVLPITAREVYVRDEKCFGVDWTESISLKSFEVTTAKLSAGMEGVSHAMLSEYLDRHIDGGFEHFVDEYFEGTYFLTELLKTAYRYYTRTKLTVIRKALKLVVAYNLTFHVTMVEGLSEEEAKLGKIENPDSKWYGKTCAPVMINFQVKCSMADLWRELMKDILEELSSLYSGVYSGEKLKNWPTIFMLAAILLAIWEEMQFDCQYRVPDQAAVKKFCGDMEATPVGVIVGLFSAISQKLPSFTEWDSRKHHHVLNSNAPVCDMMTEVRGHVTKYESYLKSRSDCKFDRQDFDSLSNKFLTKLVIRAN